MSAIIKRTGLPLIVIMLLGGCVTGESSVKAPDPAEFDEITVRYYWEMRSNLNGKIISEDKTQDGETIFGKYLLKRRIHVGSKLSLEQIHEVDAASMTDFRVSAEQLAQAGAFPEKPFTAKLSDIQPEMREVTIDKGSKDGIGVGYFAFAHKQVDEKMEGSLHVMLSRYINEDIGDVIALFEVVEVSEDSSTMKVLNFRYGRNWRDITRPCYIQFGFPRKSKFNILDNAHNAIQDLVDTGKFNRKSARVRLVNALFEFFDGDKATVTELIAHLSGNDIDNREVAVCVLQEITRQDFGFDAEDKPEIRQRAISSWLKWWDKNRVTFGLKEPERGKTKRDKSEFYDKRLP